MISNVPGFLLEREIEIVELGLAGVIFPELL
jgi:hypothetical protein